MRALTLTQPWSGLVASGLKLVENRPRPMIRAENFNEPFALHASREIKEHLYDEWRVAAPSLFGKGTLERWHALSRVTSAVIAVCKIIDALYIGGCTQDAIASAIYRLSERTGRSYENQLLFTFGPTVYVLEPEPVVLPVPVKTRGWQGFWTLPHDVELRVRDQIKESKYGQAAA